MKQSDRSIVKEIAFLITCTNEQQCDLLHLPLTFEQIQHFSHFQHLGKSLVVTRVSLPNIT